MKLSSIAFRNINRNRRRSLLCIIAIAVAAMSIVFLFSLLAGMKADLSWNVQAFFTGQVRVRNVDYDENEILNPLHLRLKTYRTIMDRIADLPEATHSVARIPFPAFIDPPTVEDPDGSNITAMGVGLDFEKETVFQHLPDYIVAGREPREGSFEILLGTGLAEKLHKKVGDKVTLLTTTMRRGPNAATFTVTGLASFKVGAMNQDYFYIPLDRAQHILKMGNSVTEVLVKFPGGTPTGEAVNLVAGILTPEDNAVARGWRELNPMMGMLGIAEAIYNVIAFMFFVLASTVIVNSIMMIIYERMREIGTIGALGMEGPQIVRLFFLEAFFMSLIGAAAGVLVGIGVTLILSYTGLDFSAGLQGVDIDVSNVIYPKLNLKSTVFVFFFAVGVASLSSLIPTRRAAKIEPVEALRHV